MKKQQGVAAIILVLVLIPLFGSVFFALEGTRYIQKKTRLADASEAAALAVTDQNPNKLNIYTEKSKQNRKQLDNYPLASAYINSYVRNINKDTDNIIITPEIFINKNKNSDKKSYYQYNVNVTTTHNSWFVNELIPSFNQTQDITAAALARNYPRLTGDQPIDLVFVADFSGSMQGDKIIKLKESIKIISNEILNNSNSNSNSNRIAFTAFSDFTQTKYDNKKNYTAILYKNNTWIEKKVKRKILPQSVISGYWYGSYNYSNIVSTFIDHENKIITRGRLYNFYDIPLTNNQVKLIKKINHMHPNGSTSAYEGIMRGAQLLYKDKYRGKDLTKIQSYNNRKKILILLSDGEESDPSILKNLVNNKLCKNIRKNFSTDNNKMFMGMVGIGYRASDNDVFHKCFDGIYETEYHLITDSNIIDVDDLSTLTDKIKELIRKGQQTDGISKLSDGQN
ncbi:hypothetical protein HPQ32_01140 [Photobacterium carnosum]|uniref:pilus assembly protein TadG-related protein n=1 Tax=Photobacterium carnosum TaxID=2023717 RepID=UPI001C902741|nr:pilus assembly protein TadG-related protein [Photobacterium carnosum]MBY3787054.1 hypothetical protein [Photobacterium carnosum]MCD9532739.1 hypothetical protein [Photobacterium carnosum]